VPVKQITVFLENKCGRLGSVAKVVGDEGINIRAFFCGRYYRFWYSAPDRE
jgi:hypothetical protein